MPKPLSALTLILMLVGCDSSLTNHGESSQTDGAAIFVAAEAAQAANSMTSPSFRSLTDAALWDIIDARGGEAVLGLKEAKKSSGVERGQILISGSELEIAKSAVLRVVGSEFLSEDDLLPIVRLRVSTVDELAALRALPVVEYIEPAAVAPPEGSETVSMNSGCTDTAYPVGFTPGRTPEGDAISPKYGGDLLRAWHRVSGTGVTIAVVGTGVSQHTPQLNADFTSGLSGGRTLTRDWTDDRGSPPWHDDCGHETKLIGFMAAPRDGRGIAGVAYSASVYSVRTEDDVLVLDDSEDVRLGIRKAARNYPIVSMAFGFDKEHESITDEIQMWAYRVDGGRRPLFIGAAGTTSATTRGGSVYPASLPEVTSVTGLEWNGDPCESCHRGSKVEFGAFAFEVSLYPDATNGGYGLARGAGSSQSVATLSAFAALVLSKYPHFTADQIRDRLRVASPQSYSNGNKDNRVGWGAPNISCAVGGICDVEVSGGPPTVVENEGTYTFTVAEKVNQTGGPIHWSIGGEGVGASIIGPDDRSTVTVRFTPHPTEERVVSVNAAVTDPITGYTVSDGRAFTIRAQSVSCGSAIACS